MSVSERFDRLPRTDDQAWEGGRADGRPPSREAVLDWWEERFGIPRSTFAGHSFWERGSGKVWAVRGEYPTPIRVQGLGLFVLRTGGEHWKPTTNAVQRFGTHATRNVVVLDEPAATTFVRGGDQGVAWDGDWGYLIVAREIAGELAPLGVGLFTDGRLRSQVPKGRRREL